MKATEFIEKVGKKKYRATTSHPIALESEGDTQDQALERLHELAKKRLASGTLTQMNLEVPSSNPWQTFARVWRNHPEFDDFLENITEYRRKMDSAK